MDIKEKLEETLKEINSNLRFAQKNDEKAILLVAKSNVLIALQRYEK